LTLQGAGPDRDVPVGFPDRLGLTHSYVALEPLLDAQGNDVKLRLDAANTATYLAADPSAFTQAQGHGAVLLFGDGGAIAPGAVMDFAGAKVFKLDLRLLDRGAGDAATAWFIGPASAWTRLGPTQPANPDLSWEYWNGSAWWALDAHELRDTTADLQLNGGLFFTVPADLAETDVGGRKNHWIRARLIGGDYGVARVTIDSTTQSVTRDLSAIRAPYVIELKLSYCAMDALTPDAVITADNLGMINQTNANNADLPVHFYPPVSTVLYPRSPEAPTKRGGEGTCCETWDDPQPASTPPAPGASLQLNRVLLIGFDQPPQGDAVSFYVDAEPSSAQAKLAARGFKGGRFTPIDVLIDETSGLNEAGAIVLRIAELLDLANLFGQSAYWLVLGPEPAADQWSPRLHGVYLNGVMARSLESRRNENIGSSSGAPDQRFRLVAAPVDPASLDLWIAEPVSSLAAAELGAAAEIEGMPGPWVRWRLENELPAGETLTPERIYTLDALTGEVSFGNGRNALVPPMGSALLARAYHQVTGQAANGVAAGAVLQTVSPIAGIDRVLALDTARGGADAETPEQALGRAEAKLRNGDRLVTLADVEEFVLARLPWVAQARAANWRGTVRLLVAARGERLVPAPSALRGIAEDVAANATFGIAAPGRLVVAGPRLLALKVTVAIEPDAGEDLVTLIETARTAIGGLFDHETGGYDGFGWPIGARPDTTDIAAALTALAERAVIRRIAIERGETGAALPPALPADVLVRVAPTDIAVGRGDD
jgi:hypothetical protein